MPDLNGIDYYSQASGPTASVTADAGLEIVGRYLWNGGKGLTDSEAVALHGAKLGIGPLYYEAHRGYLLEPDSARAHGLAAVGYSRALGIPDSIPIVHSLDEDTGPAQFPTVARCMTEINKVRGRPEGFYGEADAIDYLWDRGLISFAVNTAAVGWSGGRVSSHAAIWQYKADTPWNGHNVDLLTILNRPAIQSAIWWAPGHPTPGGFMSADVDNINLHVAAARDQILAALRSANLVSDADLKAAVDNINAHVNVVRDQNGQPDVPALAAELATELGPDLGNQLLAALAAAIAPK